MEMMFTLYRICYFSVLFVFYAGNILYALLVGYLPFHSENDDKHYELVKLGKYSVGSLSHVKNMLISCKINIFS